MEQRAVILKSDEGFLLILHLIQAQADPFENRVYDKDQEQNQLRHDEQIARYVFLPSLIA
ncbi:hypothetical protein D3C84_1095350 [compost metagenome]